MIQVQAAENESGQIGRLAERHSVGEFEDLADRKHCVSLASLLLEDVGDERLDASAVLVSLECHFVRDGRCPSDVARREQGPVNGRERYVQEAAVGARGGVVRIVEQLRSVHRKIGFAGSEHLDLFAGDIQSRQQPEDGPHLLGCLVPDSDGNAGQVRPHGLRECVRVSETCVKQVPRVLVCRRVDDGPGCDVRVLHADLCQDTGKSGDRPAQLPQSFGLGGEPIEGAVGNVEAELAHAAGGAFEGAEGFDGSVVAEVLGDVGELVESALWCPRKGGVDVGAVVEQRNELLVRQEDAVAHLGPQAVLDHRLPHRGGERRVA